MWFQERQDLTNELLEAVLNNTGPAGEPLEEESPIRGKSPMRKRICRRGPGFSSSSKRLTDSA